VVETDDAQVVIDVTRDFGDHYAEIRATVSRSQSATRMV
jgi:hypothetical protein